MLDNMRKEWRKFSEFISVQRKALFLVSTFALLSYGVKVFFYSNQFDTMQMSGRYQDVLNWWISIGRFSLVGMKRIFENQFFNVYFSNMLMLLMFVFSTVIWSYLFYYYTDENSISRKGYWIFGVVFVSTPIMVEQISFSLQNWEVMFGYILIAFAVFCFFEGYRNRKIGLFISSILIVAWCIGIYQNLIVVYVLGFLVVMLLMIESFKNNIQISKMFLAFCCTTLIGTGVYFVVNKAVQIAMKTGDNSTYLRGQIQWFSRPFRESVYVIFEYIKNLIFSNNSVYSSFIYGFVFLIFIAIGIISKNKFKGWNCLLRLLIVLTPFYFPILFGGYVNIRVQNILPITAGIVMWHTIVHFRRKEVYLLCSCAVLYFSLRNSQIMAQAFYSDYCSYNNDVRTAENIVYSIGDEFPGHNFENTIFINAKTKIQEIPDNIALENIGTSIFSISWLSDFDLQTRVADFFNCIGYRVKYWSWDEYAAVQSADLSKCVKKEYIEYTLYSYNDIVIVMFK